MTDPLSFCPDCGAPLPPDSPQALCPACLMRQALASRTISPDGGKTPQLPPPSPEEIAGRFPGYEILECLGRGGMGAVYKARQKSLNRIVAIKILAPERVGDGKFSERFSIEAELLAKLSHPHIVTIHDFGETGGLFYLVMEFIDGVNLRDLLRDGKLAPEQALAIVPPICDALQYAHDKGIVHRDIKPENLLLDRDGRIKIADFGIAKLIEPVAAVCDRRTSEEESHRRSQSAATLQAGTPHYAAPEQADGTSDHRADIYALGVVLYEMLTGERPNKEVVAPSKKVHIDVRLDEIVLRALEKTPELRYQTAGEFRSVLETVVQPPQSPGASQHSAFIKSDRGRIAWQDSMASPMVAPSSGTIELFTDKLVVTSGAIRNEIPIASIQTLHEAVPPVWWSPGGHRYLAVDYDDGAMQKRIAFQARAAVLRFVGDTKLSVAEWLSAIQRAVKSATGREIEASPGTLRLPLAVTPISFLWLLLLVPLCVPLLGVITSGAAISLTESLLASLSVMLLPLLVLSGVLIVRAASMHRRVIQRTNGENSRFSRTAIVGACWAFLGILHFIFPTLGYRMKSEFVPIMMSVIALSAPFGVTILGWVAVRQIRRSAGKLHGLGLAVFDGMFFPLLIPVVAVAFTIGLLMSELEMGSPKAVHAYALTLLVCAPLFRIIIRRVWRKVNGGGGPALRDASAQTKPAPVPESQSQPTSASTSHRGKTRGKWALGLFIAAVAGFPVLWGIMGAQEVIVLCGLTLLLSFVLGLVSWRSKSGRFAALASGLGLLVLMAFTFNFLVPAHKPQTRPEHSRNADLRQPPDLSFMPVVERKFRVDEETMFQGLDFDSGKVLTLSREEYDRVADNRTDLAGGFASWIKDNSVDLFALANTKATGPGDSATKFTATGFKLTQLSADDWDHISDELLERVAGEGDEFWESFELPTNVSLPMTFAMRSGDKLGLLQITARLQNPDVIKLRYKLVRPGVIDQVVPNVYARGLKGVQCFDFESNRFHTPPDALSDELFGAVNRSKSGVPMPWYHVSRALIGWLNQSGVDVVAASDDSGAELLSLCPGRAANEAHPQKGSMAETDPSQAHTGATEPRVPEDALTLARIAYLNWPRQPRSWFFGFITREGNRGDLQITGITDDRFQDVKIRYKLAHADQSDSAPTADASVQPGFAPVVERELRPGNELLAIGLKLESGKVETFSHEEYDRKADDGTDRRLYRDTYEFFKAKDVDLYAGGQDKAFGLAGLATGFKLGVLPVVAWDNASESELNEALEHAVMEGDGFLNGLKIPANLPLPQTYALRSGDKLGLLQITARLKNPDGIRLRYKLLQNASQVKQAAAAPPHEPAAPETSAVEGSWGDHFKRGEILRARGELDSALASYQHSLAAIKDAMKQRRQEEWPYYARRQSAKSHARIGDVLCAQGDLTGALENYRTGKAGFEPLLRSVPADVALSEDLAALYVKIGDVLQAQGDQAGALAIYRRAQEVNFQNSQTWEEVFKSNGGDYNPAEPFKPDELRKLAAESKSRKDLRRLMWLINRAGAERDIGFRDLLEKPELRKDKEVDLALMAYDYSVNGNTKALDDLLERLSKEKVGSDNSVVVALGFIDEWDRVPKAVEAHFSETDGAGGTCQVIFKLRRAYLFPRHSLQHEGKTGEGAPVMRDAIEAPAAWPAPMLPKK